MRRLIQWVFGSVRPAPQVIAWNYESNTQIRALDPKTGRELADVHSFGADRWWIIVGHKSYGVWIGKDRAIAACEQIIRTGRAP